MTRSSENQTSCNPHCVGASFSSVFYIFNSFKRNHSGSTAATLSGNMEVRSASEAKLQANFTLSSMIVCGSENNLFSFL